ncbi:MAG TPA: type II secretion system F family protein, partial [Actinomycetota bacterium]|nr:type II secretion system F family protein [Actinomycetota bacterium]
MPEFQYKARDTQGRSRTGVLEADNQAVVLERLRTSQLMPIEIKQKKGANLSADIRIPGITDRIALKDVAVGSRQLSTMINAGLPLLRALTVMTEQTENKALAKTWDQVRQDVQVGASFSAALQKHPKAFNQLYVAMVKAGETGGVLDSVLLRVADTLEKQVELRNKVKSAMTYPVMVAILVFLILMAILLFVVPTFQELYAGLGGTLPVPTRILLFLSKVVQRFFVFVILGLVGAGFLFRRSIATEKGRAVFDRVKL